MIESTEGLSITLPITASGACRLTAVMCADDKRGLIAELLRGNEHALAPSRTDLRAVAEDQGHQSPGDAGRVRDIFHPGWFLPGTTLLRRASVSEMRAL
jgi:hypothetical protein